jgi:outer membrane protein assembly factor BamD
MSVPAPRRFLLALALLFTAACHRAHFEPSKFAGSDALFQASLRELKAHHWDNAVNGFEKLTTDLPARDPLLPQAFYFLGQAHQHRHEYLLAAQAFSRIPEGFPEDTLSGPATFETGMSYAALWRNPSLDADYGQTAINTLQSFLQAYPDSPLHKRAQQEIDKLTEWFAIKNYDTGELYRKRHAYDSAIIYYTDVVKNYPTTEHARLSLLRLVESYKKINYKEEVAETCATLRQKYPGDRDVVDACGQAPPATASAPKP